MSESLESLFEELYRPLRLVGRSEKSVHQHLVVLRHFRRFLGHQPTLADLNDLTASRFLGWLSETRHQSAITCNKSLDKLLAQWRFLVLQGIVAKGPCVRRIPEPEITPVAWTTEQLSVLYKSFTDIKGWIDGVRASLWWTALHDMLYDTGERITAVLSLRKEAVDLEEGWAHFRAEIRKGKRKPKTFKLHENTIAALRAINYPERDLWFPWDRSRSLVWKRYTKILCSAGLPFDRRSKFHRLRRTVASYYEAGGGDATELLGHTSRKVTMAYLDPRIVKTKHACEMLPRVTH